jgi:hypothetical protein
VRVIVLTVDQRGSSDASAVDRVPATLTGLADLPGSAGSPLLRPFERTVGDEFQGIVDDARVLPAVLERLLREDAWNIGVGVGEVITPLPDSTRAGRGPAFVHARAAVTAAKSSPRHLRVEGDRVGARSLETVMLLWAAVLARRTERGWAVADLVDSGLRYDEVAQRLGISQSAVSQRAQAAGLVEGSRARELVGDLAWQLLGDEDRGHAP